MSLKSKKSILITGGASGIGYEIAEKFHKENYNVIVLDKNIEGVKKDFFKYECDVTDVLSLKKVKEEVLSKFEKLDTLIINAGISIRHKFSELKVEDWNKVINTNLNGVFYTSHVFFDMMNSDNGSILMTASTNGIMGYPYYADYNASKAGVIALAKAMALELAPSIRVNSICPGYVMTPMQKMEYTDEMIEEVNQKIPLKRHADPKEIAELFFFLASDNAKFITGQNYVIDGGEICGGLASR